MAMEVTKTQLDLKYEIRNESCRDMWICDDMNMNGKWRFEALFAEDGRTLIVRRRMGVPSDPVPIVGPHGRPFAWPVGNYIRLQPNGRRVQSLSFKLPVSCQRILTRARPMKDVIYADRLVLQIGFYGGDLPGAIRHILEEAERISEEHRGDFVPLPSLGTSGLGFVSLHQLNCLNKTLDDTTDAVVTPYAVWQFMNEGLLDITVDGLHIPYEETVNSSEIRDRIY